MKLKEQKKLGMLYFHTIVYKRILAAAAVSVHLAARILGIISVEIFLSACSIIYTTQQQACILAAVRKARYIHPSAFSKRMGAKTHFLMGILQNLAVWREGISISSAFAKINRFGHIFCNKMDLYWLRVILIFVYCKAPLLFYPKYIAELQIPPLIGIC